MKIYDNIFNNPGMILLFVVIGFAAIAGICFLIYKLMKRSKSQEKKPNEEEAAEQTLNMYLEDVDDENTKKEFEEYEKNKVDEDKK